MCCEDLVVLIVLTTLSFNGVFLPAGSVGGQMSYPGIRPYRREDTDTLHDGASHNPGIPATLRSICKASPVSKASRSVKARSPDLPASLQVRQREFQILAFQPSHYLISPHATSTFKPPTLSPRADFRPFSRVSLPPSHDPAPPSKCGSTTRPEFTLAAPLHTGIRGFV